MITELMEKITNTVVDIFEEKNGGSPVPYALFFFGGGGRHELTLSFNVKMGVVYQDVSSPEQQQKVDSYFRLLAETMNSSMIACDLTGKERCMKTENIQSASTWHEQFKKWGTGAGTARDRGFFDMRAIRGEHIRVNSLRQYLINRTAQSRGIMEALAADSLQIKPPLGFFKDIVVEKGGEHKNELNLYEKGIEPLVGCARIYGLEKGVIRRSTLGRLHELNSRHGFKAAEDMAQAFGYLNALLIHSQLRQAEEGGSPDNFINPDILTSFERKTLKESFQLTARLYAEKILGQPSAELPDWLKSQQDLKKRFDPKSGIRETDFVAFDTELTGLDFKQDSIISIGAVKLRGTTILPAQTFYRLVKPECELKHKSVVVHELTHTDLECAEDLLDVIGDFVKFIGDAVLIGHFVHIDLNFVNRQLCMTGSMIMTRDLPDITRG
jgi:hypothetical protein